MSTIIAGHDLVLMDCEMPELDRYGATRRIRDGRAKTRNPHIPIVASTADAMATDREKCLQAGMNDYHAQPVEPQPLGEILLKWLPATPDSNASPPPPFRLTIGTETVFNREDLLARLMGDNRLADRIVAGFLQDALNQLVRASEERLQDGDAHSARQQAHALKGAAATSRLRPCGTSSGKWGLRPAQER
jgi:CheY-like chemotaxis protein